MGYQKSRLKREIRDRIRASNKLIGVISDESGYIPITIIRWLDKEDPQLTLPTIQTTIRRELNIPEGEEIIEIYNTEPATSTIN